MIDCMGCQFYDVKDSTCRVDTPLLMPDNPSFTSYKIIWPPVSAEDWCARGKAIEETPGQEATFSDNFQSGWFEVNSPFDIRFYENCESNWWIQNDFGSSIFVEDFQGVW